MSGDGICSRCGRPLIAGQCTICGAVPGAPPPPPQRTFPRGTRRVASAVLLLLAFFTRFLIYQHRWNAFQSAQTSHHLFPRHQGPIAKLSELHGHGTIYLVQFTPHSDAYSVQDLAAWLHTRYRLSVQVLPPQPLPQSAWNGWRHQYVAELLYDRIQHDHPRLAANPDAFLIGLTDASLYSAKNRWSGTFSQRDGERTAIISSGGMGDPLPLFATRSQRNMAAADLQARLRRILLKNVAILYWGLPVNNDPSSVLHQPQDPDLPTEDIYESDLNPAQTPWGQFEGEPCIFFLYSPKNGLQPMPGYFIHTCSEALTRPPETDTEVFEVNLRLGYMVDRRTDLLVPGPIPLSFERTLYPGWKGYNAFGASGTSSFDSYLESTNPAAEISVAAADNTQWSLVHDRSPLAWLHPPTYRDAEFAGRYYTLRWQTTPYPHYDLTRYDGRVEAFLPCSTAQQFCYLNGVKDAGGQELKFTRGRDRHLEEVDASDGRWFKATWDTLHSHISQADDSLAQTVRYSYNQSNQLTGVELPSGETLSFTYDNANEMLTFSASPDGKTPPKLLLSSEYRDGRIVRQTLADGRFYGYGYGPVSNRVARLVTVTSPDGAIYAIQISASDISTIWEQAPVSATAAAITSTSSAP